MFDPFESLSGGIRRHQIIGLVPEEPGEGVQDGHVIIHTQDDRPTQLGPGRREDGRELIHAAILVAECFSRLYAAG
jgi:hypothetical protein